MSFLRHGRGIHAFSVVEVKTVQAGSGPPFMLPCRQVHREVDVSAQRPEPGGMETAYGSDIASYGPDGQVLVATGPGLLGNPASWRHVASEYPPASPADAQR